MAAPEGNQNAAKGALFNSALRRALARHSGKNVDSGLNDVADQLVLAAVKGESWAIKEIADRLDGKPAQTHGFDQDNPLQVALQGRIKIVRPNS